MRKVVVTGLGVMSPVGNGRDAFFASLIAGRSGVRRLRAEGMPRLAASLGAEVDFDPSAHFPRPRLGLLDRFSQLALLAAAEAMRDARIEADDARKANAGVYLGTGQGGAGTTEAAYLDLLQNGKDRLPPYMLVRAMCNAAAAHVSMEHALCGPSLTFSTACSSSAIAVGEAARALRHGYVDLAIAGGAESLLTLGTIRAWEALRALATEDPGDPSASCRPFSLDRTGLVLGEGAGMVVLEPEELARARGATIYAELAGYGATSDASHLTQPSPLGQAAAMRRALEDAGLRPEDIGYINAHGTATVAGDRIEVAAIEEVFGAHAARLAVSSTKALHGHLLGAAGAVELIASILAMERSVLPPTAHLRVPDPACDLDHVPGVARSGVALEAVMSNSFAFGGSNAVLVARRARGAASRA